MTKCVLTERETGIKIGRDVKKTSWGGAEGGEGRREGEEGRREKEREKEVRRRQQTGRWPRLNPKEIRPKNGLLVMMEVDGGRSGSGLISDGSSVVALFCLFR